MIDAIDQYLLRIFQKGWFTAVVLFSLPRLP